MIFKGLPIRSSLSSEDTENYSALVSQLAFKASGVVSFIRHISINFYLKFMHFLIFKNRVLLQVRTLDDTDELAFLRIRSKKHEIMIAPDKDYVLVVIQNPHEN